MLDSLLAARRPNHSLDAPFYTDPAIYAADLERIFGRHWIYVGVEPDVAEPGDAVTVDIGSASVIIVRDDDEVIRAFHNVCRHRGARLIPGERATVGNLVCPYHSWTYALDGRLIHAEHMGADFDRSCRGLKPVHLRSVAGLLFICLSDTPPDDIDDLARVMTPYLAPHDIANTKIARQIDIVEHGNWKLTMENNRECYHCAANHPELTIPLFAYGFGFSPESLDDSGPRQRRALRRAGHVVARDLGSARPAVPRDRAACGPRHGIPNRTPAARSQRTEPHDRHARRLPPLAGIAHRTGLGRA